MNTDKIDAPKLALVTGASRGIGVAIVHSLLGLGCHVHALARDLGALNSVYAGPISQGDLTPFAAATTDEKAIRDFAAAAYADTAPDLLFNNAGRFVSMAPIWESDTHDWWEDVRVNVLGTYTVTRAVLPAMMRRDKGIIVNMGGGRPGGGSGYAVSKAGVSEFTRALDGELRLVGSRIAVFLADPGLVDTGMSRPHAQNPHAAIFVPELVNRIGAGDTRPPEDIANGLVSQLPYMTPERSGGFFTPDTKPGEFASSVGI